MKDKIKNALFKAKAGLAKIRKEIHFEFKWHKIMKFTSRYGYYAGLFVLLVILGVASNAYRKRTEEVPAVDVEVPIKVSNAIVPVPTATPIPYVAEEKTEYMWPVAGEIITGFSPESLVWNNTLSQWQTHPGIDICAGAGQSVTACADGLVKDAYLDPVWGNVIIIVHENGMESVYANLNTLNLVFPGQKVKMGETISAIGKSAAAEENMAWHLHFEFKNQKGEYENFSGYVGENKSE